MAIAVEDVVVAGASVRQVGRIRWAAADGDDFLHGHAVFDLLDQRLVAVGDVVHRVFRAAATGGQGSGGQEDCQGLFVHGPAPC
ncbi:hypothetical protein D3C73_1181640 [compost metagenome]